MDNANSRTGPISASSADILDMRTEALDIIRHDNPHEVINNLFLDQGKDAVRAKNGENLTQTAKGLMLGAERKTTRAVKEGRKKKEDHGVRYQGGYTQPATKDQLEAEAKSDARHSTILGKHLKAAGDLRPSDAKTGSVASHHIVAVTDPRAMRARMLLFKWGIGINDADNGVRLPRWLSSEKPGRLANATVHAIVHTDVYHVTVHYRLRQVAKIHPNEDTFARVELRGMKQELVAGVFPYQ